MAKKRIEIRLPSKPANQEFWHGWRSRPDHKILVLDRGAVHLEYPADWVVEGDEDSIKLRDHEPPDDECTLGVSYHFWPGLPGDHPALRVGALVETAMSGDDRYTARDPILEETRIDLHLAWSQGRFLDKSANREALSRLCIARRGEVQALISFDFWADDLARCDALWHDILATIQVAEWVEDPAKGPLLA
jgi:hypothetical protein